jgi:hypothetical protein|tara:strand:+ start:871 stop:2040 length:1170 start_codon:yes stop_codon:yes gene_type:complete
MSKTKKEGPVVDDTKEGLKIKKKMGKPKKMVTSMQTTKIDLTKKEEPKTEETPVVNVITKAEETPVKVIEDVKEEVVESKENPIIQEITEEEVKQETKVVEQQLKEAVRDEETIGRQLPENIEKLVSFMEETGGDVADYVRLNADYTNINENVLLREYYKQTKPHLEHDEVDFILEDNYSWDEEVDEERDIKKKKLAFKEEIAKARNFLEQTKSKYYDEIKLRPGVTQEQKKATDFFNRYNKEQDIATKQHSEFEKLTNQMFSDEFKGFDFNVGEKKFRYGVSNPSELAKSQSNLSHFVKKFLNEDGSVKDHVGYHKAIYAADNADTIAKHFYEQGKADAVKDVVAKSKNINIESRTPASEGAFINGFRVKAISGVDSSKLKIKSKKNN